MKTKTITLYSFSELSEDSQKKALNSLSDINVDYDWSQGIYEDAKKIGLKITGFDTDRYCGGEFIEDAIFTAEAIKINHGENCETYKTAISFLAEFMPKGIEWEANNDGDSFLESNEGEQLASEFLKSLLEDYRIILRKDYEHLTSEVAILEAIEANEYTFTKDGKLENA